MNLDKRIFWDVDYSKIDWEKNAAFVIVRVFERGDIEDIRTVRRHYGDEKLREVLLAAPYISLKRIYLASAIIDEPVTNFKCYSKKQSNPTHLPY